MADLSEQLFDAIGIIAQNLVKDLQYDKTIICTITDTSRADEGIYTVSSGSAEFQATSNQKYVINTPVYVTIPQNDFNNEKIIVGKYTDANKAYEYIKPSDNFINITGNIVYSKEDRGIIANKDQPKLIATTNIGGYEGYDRLVVSTKFKTLFSDNNMPVSGNYGLLIQIDGITNTSQNTYLFDSDDMYGNVYNFIVGSNQEKMFDISNFTRINKINVILFQNNNFKDELNNLIVPTNEPNILVDSLAISLGHALTNYNSDTVILYTLDDNSFSPNDNEKTLQLRWAHLNQNGQMVSINQNEDPQMTAFEWQLLQYIDGIKWYRWKFEDGVKDNDAGMFWQLLEDNSINLFEKIIELDAENLPEERFKVIIQFYTNEDLVKIEEDINKKGWSEIDTILSEYQKVSYASETIIFDNTEVDQYKTAVELIKNLELTTDDLYNGIYNIYDDDGSLMNEVEANKLHQLVAMYKSIYTENEEFDGEETIYWYFPRNNSMILAPETGKEFSDGELISGDDKEVPDYNPEYYIIKRKVKYIEEEHINSAGELVSKVAKQTFRIQRNYSQIATNNTIICKVEKNKKLYITTLQLVFGTSGTQGTHYTLSLNPVGDQPYINFIKDSKIEYEAKLQGYDGEYIEATNYDFILDNNHPFVKNQNGSKCILIASRNLTTADVYILTVKITYNNIQLQAQYPIMINFQSDTVKSFEGATKITYDSYGVNPIYYKNPYQLYQLNTNNQYIPIEGLTWYINSDGGLGVPTLSNNILKPANFFVSGNKKVAVVAKKSNQNYFLCPLIINQNRWGNSLINEWDGQVEVNDETNFIGAATIAAGVKTQENGFSGVILGQDGTTNNQRIGLYGYQSGVQSFGFREDGTAFIGKSGSGRIEFDGNRGIIQSSSFDFAQGDSTKIGTGLQIDLDGNNDKKSYLTIKENNKVLFQSASDGTTIGKFKLGVNSTSDGNEIGYIKSNNENLILQSDGALIAKAGSIGKWVINNNSLSSESGGKGLILSPSSGIQVGVLTPGTQNQLFTNVDPELVVDRNPVTQENINKYVIADNETTLYWQINGISGGNYTYKKESIYSGDGFSIDNIGNLTSTKDVNLKNLTVTNIIKGTCQKVQEIPWHTHSFNLALSGAGSEETWYKVAFGNSGEITITSYICEASIPHQTRSIKSGGPGSAANINVTNIETKIDSTERNKNTYAPATIKININGIPRSSKTLSYNTVQTLSIRGMGITYEWL